MLPHCPSLKRHTSIHELVYSDKSSHLELAGFGTALESPARGRPWQGLVPLPGGLADDEAFCAGCALKNSEWLVPSMKKVRHVLMLRCAYTLLC